MIRHICMFKLSEDAAALAAYSECEIHQQFKRAISNLKTARACIDHEF